MPLMPAHGRFQEFEGRLVYGVKFQGSQATQRNPRLKKEERGWGKKK